MSRVKNASTPPPIRPLLRKASYASSSSDECNPPSKCLSPIPHSESNSDDDTGDDPSALDDVDLETIISSVPEPQLRTIMMRLAGGNHRFRLAILRELMALGMANSCHNPTSEHKRTTSKRRVENIQSPLSLRCTNCNQFFNPSLLTKCVFHPGDGFPCHRSLKRCVLI
ncbi:hypothetical protein K435DRAFT_434095 [Dendrothele bispora CBS 962.96]|uniref:Uncharacterized protein n=1 Tax=Dendrothele bispora (strain CBS 962.96) TaxID=1314807 RepID=A0A4S8L3Q9_DENBC|nr:hypothetical protein K435DRAFT_434095 [Dendrothele bispora CBS 962.96]